jgi:hypothetical protein
VLSFTPRPRFTPGKEPPVPIGEEVRWPQSPSGRRGEEKILDPSGTRTPTPRSSIHSQLIYRLRYPWSSSHLIYGSLSFSSLLTPGMIRETVSFALDIQPIALCSYLLMPYYFHKLHSSSVSSSLLRSTKVVSSSWLINLIIYHPSHMFSSLSYTYLHRFLPSY